MVLSQRFFMMHRQPPLGATILRGRKIGLPRSRPLRQFVPVLTSSAPLDHAETPLPLRPISNPRLAAFSVSPNDDSAPRYC